MWEKLKTLSQHPAAQALKKFCGDPVQLYSVFLIMTAMYYYHQGWSWLYTLIALALSFVLMRFYDFVARKGLLGSLCYLVFLGVGLYASGMVIGLGQRNYPITFTVWFLTPQSIVDFSMGYTIAIYMLMVGFITSAVYYFAKVRYRMVMQLIIMLIPLSLYAKENLHMPALLVILLLASYFLLMVYCRQLREDKEMRKISGFHSGVSIVIYVAAFSILAAIVPKPQFQADREFIDNALSYSTWSDTLMAAISMFTDTTDNTVSTSNNTRTIYYANAEEMLRLRMQTYSYYQEDDSWSVIYDYDRPDQAYAEPLTYQPRALMQTILDAAAADPGFAEVYGLSDLAGTTLPEQSERELYVFTWYSTTSVPSPTRTIGLTEGRMPNIRQSNTDTIAMLLAQNGVGVQYYPDAYARQMDVSALLGRLSGENYLKLLEDAQDVLASDPEAVSLLGEAYSEAIDAYLYWKDTESRDYHSDVIDDLAAQLTEGLDSDYEKARAIEQYFVEEGYIYDLSYTKEPGENVDDFLTTSHRGVCYEYATAMTLLCRSAGLPTRFASGYNMNEYYETNRGTRDRRDTNFVIKMRDAHAFPEVYISGYGWLSFEPTVPSDEEEETAQNQVAMRWGYVLLGLALLVLGFWALLPYLREQHFRRKLRGMTPEQAAGAAFVWMRRILSMPDSATVAELQKASVPFFAEDSLFSSMDALLYNPTERSVMTAGQLAETYIRWQAKRKAYVKELKKLRKEQKKSNVNV